MIEAILQHASRPDGNPYISMTYGKILNDFHQRYAFQVIGGNANLLPTEKGIYFLLSHQKTRLQKIGKANGEEGLQQRFIDYIQRPTLPLKRTPKFLYRIMTGNVQGNEQLMPNDYGQIDLYFRPFAQLQKPINDPFVNGLGIEFVDYDPHAVLENMFIGCAANLRIPNINGLFQADEKYPLLLDSANRIRNYEFAQI